MFSKVQVLKYKCLLGEKELGCVFERNIRFGDMEFRFNKKWYEDLKYYFQGNTQNSKIKIRILVNVSIYKRGGIGGRVI